MFGDIEGEEDEEKSTKEQQEDNGLYKVEEFEEKGECQENEPFEQSEEDFQEEQDKENGDIENEEEFENKTNENQMIEDVENLRYDDVENLRYDDVEKPKHDDDLSELEDMALDELDNIEEVDKPHSSDKEEPFEDDDEEDYPEDDDEFREISVSYDDKNIPTFEVVPKKVNIKPPSSLKDCKIEFVLRYAFYFYFLGLAYIYKLDEKPEFVEKFMEKSKKQIDLLILRLEKTAVQIAPNTYKKIVENSEIIGTLLIAVSLHYNFHTLAMEYKKSKSHGENDAKHISQENQKTQDPITPPIQKVEVMPNTQQILSPY